MEVMMSVVSTVCVVYTRLRENVIGDLGVEALSASLPATTKLEKLE